MGLPGATHKTSLYHHIDEDVIRRHPDKPRAWISIQTKRNDQKGIPNPSVFAYALHTIDAREKERKIQAGVLEPFVRDVPIEKRLRVYVSEDKALNKSPNVRKLISRWAREVDPGLDFNSQSDSDVLLLARDYFQSLMQNQKLSGQFLVKLLQASQGNGNQGPGLGPTNERRAGLALAMMMDAGHLKGFQILGEAGKSIKLNDELKQEKAAAALSGKAIERLDYSAHEEAMAVDILAQLPRSTHTMKAGQSRYIPIQIKSTGSVGYDKALRYLTFTQKERDEVLAAFPGKPEWEKYFSPHPDEPGKFRLRVKRKVLKLALNNRKIVKRGKADYEPDIVNKFMVLTEHAKRNKELIITDKPYQKHSYAEKVILMIKSGILTPINLPAPKPDFDCHSHAQISPFILRASDSFLPVMLQSALWKLKEKP